MKKISIVLIFCVCILNDIFCNNNNADTLFLTLYDCLDIAHSNNYNRQINESAKDALIEGYRQSKNERLPNLTISLGEGFSNSNSGQLWRGDYGINTSMVLYQGGLINRTIKSHLLRKEQAEFELMQFDNDLTLEILREFLTILGNKELLRYQQATLSFSKEQVKQGYDLFLAERMIESEYLLLEAQYNIDCNNVYETELALINDIVKLKYLMSVDIARPLQIIYPDSIIIQEILSIPSQEHVLKRSLEVLPEINISAYDVELAKVNFKSAKSSYYPTIVMDGYVGTGHYDAFSKYGTQLSDNLYEQIKISVNIPIFNKGKSKSNVNQKRFLLHQAELHHKQSILDLQQRVIRVYNSVLATKSRYNAIEIKHNAYLALLEVYRNKLNLGTITVVEFLQQQDNYLNVLNNFIQSKYDFLLQRMILNIYTGDSLDL